MAAKRALEDSDDETTSSTKRRKPSNNHWKKGLLNSMKDPDCVLTSDDKCIIIKDKFPKSQHHFLALPRDDIKDIGSLDGSHVILLQHILDFSRSYIANNYPDDVGRFKYGYHAVPCMDHLHMHIISQDFDSVCLKNKKHWNSFTTDFFMDASKTIEQLKVNGKIRIDRDFYESLLKEPLRCHICRREMRNLPQLKRHITTH
jgi:aprataxin